MPILAVSDWISLLGIVISLAGFWLALVQIRKTTTAAESARDAAKLAKEGVGRLDSLIGFTSVAKTVDEIKSAYRADQLERLPALFDQARKALIAARESHPHLNDDDRFKIQRTLTFFTELELISIDMTSEAIAAKKQKYTKTMIEISDDINTIASKMKASGDR